MGICISKPVKNDQVVDLSIKISRREVDEPENYENEIQRSGTKTNKKIIKKNSSTENDK